MPPSAVNQPNSPVAQPVSAPSVDSLDVLILYTQEAARHRGGEAGIRALAGLAVGHVNEAFQNSGVQASLRLVALEPWLHQSAGEIGGDIRAMTSDTGIAALRTRHNADLVAGFVAGRAQGAVGVGSLLMNPAGQPQACWSVVRAEAVGAPFYTFAHEIGHNLGCNHAADQGAGSGAFSYSHGWRFIGGNGQKYRTLLSYQRFANERRIPFSPIHTRAMRALRWGRPRRIMLGRSTKRRPRWLGIVRRFLSLGSSAGGRLGGPEQPGRSGSPSRQQRRPVSSSIRARGYCGLQILRSWICAFPFEKLEQRRSAGRAMAG